MSGNDIYAWLTGGKNKCSNPRCGKIGMMQLEVMGKSYCNYKCYDATRPTYAYGKDYVPDGDHR